MKRTLVRWVFGVLGAFLLAMWILFTIRSNDTMPWNNEWLVALVLLAIVAFVGLPQYTLPLPKGASREVDAEGDLVKKPEYRYPGLRAVATFAALFFGVTWLLMIPIATSEGEPGSMIVERDGRDVAVVAYNRYGPQGMLQIALRTFFPQNVVAIDVETGKHLWTAKIANDNFITARVIAANEDYAYVANASGLRVLDMATGDTVARPADIAGLDDDSRGAGRFVLDPGTDRILARTEAGLVQLRVGELTTSPATEEDGYNWTPLLGDIYHDIVSTHATEREAAAGVDLLEVDDDGIDAQGPDGEYREITTQSFDGGRFVVDRVPGTRAAKNYRYSVTDTNPLMRADTNDAVGVAGGYVVVSQTTYGSNSGTILTTVSLESGEVLDSISVKAAPTGGSTSASGSSIITLGELMFRTSPVVLVSPEGKISTSMIGRADFFGTAM